MRATAPKAASSRVTGDHTRRPTSGRSLGRRSAGRTPAGRRHGQRSQDHDDDVAHDFILRSPPSPDHPCSGGDGTLGPFRQIV